VGECGVSCCRLLSALRRLDSMTAACSDDRAEEGGGIGGAGDGAAMDLRAGGVDGEALPAPGSREGYLRFVLSLALKALLMPPDR
jgi:hypothetical protein